MISRIVLITLVFVMGIPLSTTHVHANQQSVVHGDNLVAKNLARVDRSVSKKKHRKRKHSNHSNNRITMRDVVGTALLILSLPIVVPAILIMKLTVEGRPTR